MASEVYVRGGEVYLAVDRRPVNTPHVSIRIVLSPVRFVRLLVPLPGLRQLRFWLLA